MELGIPCKTCLENGRADLAKGYLKGDPLCPDCAAFIMSTWPIKPNPKRDRWKSHERYCLPFKLSLAVDLPLIKIPWNSTSDGRPAGCIAIRADTPKLRALYGMEDTDFRYLGKMTQAFRDMYENILGISEVENEQWGPASIELHEWPNGEVGACTISRNCISHRILGQILPE